MSDDLELTLAADQVINTRCSALIKASPGERGAGAGSRQRTAMGRLPRAPAPTHFLFCSPCLLQLIEQGRSEMERHMRAVQLRHNLQPSLRDAVHSQQGGGGGSRKAAALQSLQALSGALRSQEREASQAQRQAERQRKREEKQRELAQRWAERQRSEGALLRQQPRRGEPG